MKITFRQMIVAEIIAILMVSLACWCLHLRLVSVAQAKEVVQPIDDIYVVNPDGSEVKYSPSTVITTVEVTTTRSKIAQSQRKPNWFRNKVYAEYSKYQYFKTGRIYLKRIEQYQAIINQASTIYGLDPDLLVGLIAVESMGLPNSTSPENAGGLTQILQVPNSCRSNVRQKLNIAELHVYEPKHNIYLGACTLATYTQTKNDLLLGLVSYNYGPNRDSVVKAKTLYSLKVGNEIKSYPVKVYALTLMAKIKRQHGKILVFNDANRGVFDAIDFPGTTD